jgi:hypothetical protein
MRRTTNCRSLKQAEETVLVMINAHRNSIIIPGSDWNTIKNKGSNYRRISCRQCIRARV